MRHANRAIPKDLQHGHPRNVVCASEEIDEQILFLWMQYQSTILIGARFNIDESVNVTFTRCDFTVCVCRTFRFIDIVQTLRGGRDWYASKTK